MQTVLERYIAYPHPPKYEIKDIKRENVQFKELYLPKYKLKTYMDEITPRNGLNKLNFTIIYAHSNGENILMLHSLLQSVSNVLRCRIVSFDYLGYGATPGRPTERSSQYVGDQVYNYVTDKHKADKVIVWGRSIGSGVASYLGKKHGNELFALIIESGLSSAVNVILKRNSWVLGCCNQFRNSGKLKDAAKNTKLLIIHGTNDEVIPLRCSLRNFVRAAPKSNRGVQELREIQDTQKHHESHGNQNPSGAQVHTDPLRLQKPQKSPFPLVFSPKLKNKNMTNFDGRLHTATQRLGNVVHVSILGGGHNDLITHHTDALLRSVIDFLGPAFASCDVSTFNQRQMDEIQEARDSLTRKNLFFV